MNDGDIPKLDWWFLNPAKKLLETKDRSSDGAFLVLSAALSLYERYLVLRFRGTNWEEDRAKVAAKDLDIQETHFALFWDCFRNGLLHQFQPRRKNGRIKYYWDISDIYSEKPQVTEGPTPSSYHVRINPWAFAELVRRKFEENPGLFDAADTHAAGEVRPLTGDLQIENKSHIPDGSHYLPPTQLQPLPSPPNQNSLFATGDSRLKRQ